MKNYFIVSVMALMLFAMPLSLAAMDYDHTLEAEDLQFSWSIKGNHIHVQMSAKTTGWVAVGFDPEKAMEGANIIIGAVKDGKFRVEDHYGNRKRGHESDESLGGKSDVQNPSGSETDGVTTISFSFPLDTGDIYDKVISPEGMTKVMLAYGAGKDSFRNRHPYRTVYEINLSTGESNKIK